MKSRIRGTTRLTGLIGYPVGHSISPIMHNTAFEYLGLDYAYLAFEIKKDDLKSGIEAMKTLGVAGFNVTMPLKESILPLLDDVSREVELIGSVNTVMLDDGRLIGYNTDGKGYIRSLEDENILVPGKRILIAGAGGAARSIAVQLALEGVDEIIIANRTLDKGEEICQIINKNIPSCKSKTIGYDEERLKSVLNNTDVFINCTSLGMFPNEDKSIINSPVLLHSDLIVSDIIYHPRKTKLLKMAESIGCKTINGIGMIIHQGALAFKIWTGHDMPIDYIKRTLLFNE